MSGDSGATSATTTTAPYTRISEGDSGGGGGGSSGNGGDPSDGRYNARGRRRHAINITSNPGYQVNNLINKCNLMLYSNLIYIEQ